MKLTELAIRRPILFIVLYIVIAGLGVMSYSKLRYELLPELATPFITVTAIYPGASPVEIENTVAKKLEDAISGVSKIKKVSTYSAQNAAVISIEFKTDASADKALQDVQKAINQILPELPKAVKSPVVESYNLNAEPVLRIGATANIAEDKLYALLDKQIKPGISQINHIGRVTLLGGTAREIKIKVDCNKLAAYGVGIDEVANAIGRNNIEIPIGNLKAVDGQFDMRTSGKVTDLEQLRMQVVRRTADGGAIYVKDLAVVTDDKKEATIINRVNGLTSIGLVISKQNGANAVEASKLVRTHLLQLEESYRNIGLHFSIIQDSSEFTLKAAYSVYEDFAIALVLVAVVMLLFLHSIRNALIVLVAIPTSLVTAFIMMYLLDYSLNLMTLLAMSLVIGILVDDSIVVLENIYRHLEMGADRKKASLDGRNEIGFAAMSITLVDVVVFLPLAFVPGLVGSLVKEFSLVIVVSTLSSLMVSFTLTPMIASRFAKLEHVKGNNLYSKGILLFEKAIDRVASAYAGILSWALKHKWQTIIISLAFLISSFSLMVTGSVGSEFVPQSDKGELSLLLTAAPGTPLEEMDKAVKHIENRISKMPEVKKQFTLVGFQSDGVNEYQNSNYAGINISLVEADQRDRSLATIGRDLKRIALQEPGIKAEVTTVGLFGSNAAPIQLLLYGQHRDSVLAAADKLLQDVKKIDGVVAPKLSVEDTKPSLQVDIDRKKLSELGLTVEDISYSLRIAINGYDELKYSQQDEEVDMRIVLREEEKTSVADLEDFPFINDQGQKIYLKQFAEVKFVNTLASLERRNKQAAVMLLAKVTGRPTGDVGEDIKKLINQKPLPSSVSLSYEGDLDMQDDAFGDLAIALGLSLSLIYLIMVALYNNWVYPFVVLFSIPVGIGGAIIALALTAKSLNIFSIFGLIMMMGLVAKNAILLVDRANERLAEGDDLMAALMDAGKTRLRPIMMTTFAMVIGMLPLALSHGASAEMISSLAWVLIGGLTSSMFLTLVLVPVVHYKLTVSIRKKTGVVLSIFLLIGLAGNAQQVKTHNMTVEQAVATGISQNRMVRVGELNELRSRYATKEIQADRYPQINGTASYIRNLKPSYFFFPKVGVGPTGDVVFDESKLNAVNASAKNYFNGLVDLRLPLFNTELQNGMAASRLSTELARADQRVTTWELADAIRTACYNVLLAILNKELVTQSLHRAVLTLNDTRVLYKNQMLLVSDTLNVYINVESQKPNVYAADNQVAQATDYLKDLLGIPLDNDLVIKDSINELYLQQQVASAQMLPAFNDRPDITRNLVAQQLAKAQIRIDKNRKLPSLSFVSQYQLQAQEDHFTFSRYSWPQSFYVGVQLSVPIFNGFKNDYKARQSYIAVQQLKIEEEQLHNQAAMAYSKATRDLAAAMSNIKVQQKILIAAEESLALIRSRYQKGASRYQDVLDGQFTFVQAQNAYNKAVYDGYMALAAKKKAIGIN